MVKYLTSFASIEKAKTKESHMDPLGQHYPSINFLHLQLQPHGLSLSREQTFLVYQSYWSLQLASTQQNLASNNQLIENIGFHLLVNDPRTNTHTSTTTRNFRLRVSFTFLAPLDPSENIGEKSENLSLLKNRHSNTTTLSPSKPECLRASLDTSIIKQQEPLVSCQYVCRLTPTKHHIFIPFVYAL